MKRVFVGSFLVSVLCMNSLRAQDPATGGKLTIQQAIETGLAKNLDVKNAEILMRQNKIDWNQARLDMLPDLNGSASSGINTGRSIDPNTNNYITQQVNYATYGLNSGVILFNGLAMQNTSKSTALYYQAAKMDWQQVKDNLTINIILAYLQVLTNEDLLAQAQSQAGLSRQQMERLEILNKDGAILPSLLSDLKGQYANDQLTIIGAVNTLESSKIDLSRLMNVPYDTNVQLERISAESYATKYEATPDSIYLTALEQFSMIKAVDFRVEAGRRDVKAARGRLFPILSLNAGTSTNYSTAARNQVLLSTSEFTSTDYVTVNGIATPVIKQEGNYSFDKIGYGKQLNNNFGSNVSLNLNIPIFNALIQRNRVKRAKIALEGFDAEAKTTKTQLQLNIEQSYMNMTTASNRYKTLIDQVAAYTESFNSAEIRFNAGVGTSIDYLTAKNNFDRSNINLIAAKYDYVLRTKILDYYQGKQLW